MLFVSYIRVSTGAMAIDGQSLQNQAEQLRNWGKTGGHTCIGEFTDAGISGRSLVRPGIQAALTMACQNHCALVVCSLSRLARSTRDALHVGDELTKAKGVLVSLNENLMSDSPTGKLIWTLLSAVAQWERETIADRTQQVMDFMRRRRLRISGHPPYGWEVGGRDGALLPVPAEQELLKRMQSWRSAGWSYPKIASALSMECRTKQGRSTWRASSIRRILVREAALAEEPAA
jgi:site-specific DNA recombinase